MVHNGSALLKENSFLPSIFFFFLVNNNIHNYGKMCCVASGNKEFVSALLLNISLIL